MACDLVLLPDGSIDQVDIPPGRFDGLWEACPGMHQYERRECACQLLFDSSDNLNVNLIIKIDLVLLRCLRVFD